METQQNKTKQALLDIMFEVFEIIESLDITDGKYLQLANLMRDMNINVNRLGEIRTIIINNTYYRNRNNTLRRKRLTEAEKINNPDYALCNCGRYFKFYGQQEWKVKKMVGEHYNSLVHKQGIRNRKYANKNYSKAEIDGYVNRDISREVACHQFIISRLAQMKVIDIDDANDDEIVSV